jgi:cobalt-zinc-cadmium efflux system outer membrane protein
MRLSIPLPLWNRNESEQAEQAANVERAQLESTAILSQIESDADTARREMIALSAMAKETREKLLPLANEQTNSLKKAYENGQTELATLLRASDQRLQLEAAALDAERDFHLARIRYESATGIHAPAP